MTRKKQRAKTNGRGRIGPDAVLAAAISHHQAGRLAKARQLYGQVLVQQPKHAVALHLLGVVRFQQGDSQSAVERIERAVALRPDYADAHSNLGNVLKEVGRLDDAVAACRKAIALKPDFADAHNNLGNALLALDRLDEASAAFRKVVALDANHAAAQNNLGNALRRLGRLDDAAAALQSALAQQPDFAEAHNNLGNVLSDQGKLDEAVASYGKALALTPDYAEAYGNLANTLRRQGKGSEAIEMCRKAVALKPDYAEAHNNLGLVLSEQGRTQEAMAAYRAAMAAMPDSAMAHSNLLFCMNYDAEISQADILAESLRWNAAHAPDEVPRPDSAAGEGRLRVGYVSPDFVEHSVAYFLEPLIAAHDREHIEVFCYAEVAKPDATTTRFRELADHWCITVGMTDAALAARIREDGIAILVDVAGHTAENRLPVFAKRPAGVQVTWLGYPNTSGLSAMDYRLTDAAADPPGEADDLHSETLLRLADGFLCYAPPADAPAPSRDSGPLTFGSFNNLAKITPQVVETWASVLGQVPDSRLLLKSRPFADAPTRQRIADMFAGHGIEPERLDLLPHIAGTAGHLGAYARIDIGLDPFPYNGTTTTCEALWMGVPVITLFGDRHAGRVGASILSRLGLDEFVAENRESYVETAMALANDSARLTALRHNLRARMQASPLCDTPAFARQVEAAFRQMLL